MNTPETQPEPLPPAPGSAAERMKIRADDVIKIREAYDQAESALRKVGHLLRTTHAGQYLWAGQHKSAIVGLCVVLRKLRDDVPFYEK